MVVTPFYVIKQLSPHAADDDAVGVEDVLPVQLNGETTQESLLATLIDRFKRLTTDSLNPTSGSTTSAARYIIAILGLSAYAHHSTVVASEKSTEKRQTGAKITSNIVISPKLGFELLESIEVLWSVGILRLEPNAYATVLIATMDIILLIASQVPNMPNGFNSVGHTDLSEQDPSTHDNPHVVDFAGVQTDLHATVDHQLRMLRAYYSQWLLRVSYLLQIHANDKNPTLDDQELVSLMVDQDLIHRLLDGLARLAGCSTLNPTKAISTHLSPDETAENHAFIFVLQDKNRGRSSEIQPDDLHKGPLGAIIELLRKHPGMKDESSVKICLAALQAYSALAPILLSQVLELSKDELTYSFSMDRSLHDLKKDMIGLRYTTARFALLTAEYLGRSHKRNRSLFRFCDNVFGLLKYCLEQDGSYRFRANSYRAITYHGDELIPLLRFAGESKSNRISLSNDTRITILTAAAVQTTSQGVTACDNSLTPECFPALIYMVDWFGSDTVPLEELFRAMVRRMRADGPGITRQRGIPWKDIPAIQYIYQFTRSKQGFRSLSRAIRKLSDISPLSRVVASTLIDIVHLAAGKDPALKVEQVELALDAVPSFLGVVSDTFRYLWEDESQGDQMIQLSTDMLTLLEAAVKDESAKEQSEMQSNTDFTEEHKSKVWGTLKDLIGFAIEDDAPVVGGIERKGRTQYTENSSDSSPDAA
ncbi:E3 ubiquitin-protein ligase listerin [Ceratobasidium sp. AG-Ba]|nr:E3 ubiquitin-protein ligase listerin [Ceratobasidium sp. AG-Ba]